MLKKAALFILLMSLCLGNSFAQLDGVVTYDFRDGSIITNGQSDDGMLTLLGNYSHHGEQYGLNMKVDGEISIAVPGSCTVRFLGSQYNGLTMVGTVVDKGDLGSHDTKVMNDLSDIFEFTYSGDAVSLNFKLTAGSGNDLYLPTIEVIPAQAGSEATMADKNIVYYFDLRDGSIIPTDTDGQTDFTLGLFGITVGTSNAYGYNGDQHGSILKTGNQITLQVAGNSTIKVGGSIYSNGTITVSSETGDFDIATQNSVTATNFDNGRASVDFLYVGEAGMVTLDFTGTNYIPYIEIVPVPFDVSLGEYVQKSGTVTINGVEIQVTSGATSADDAMVTVSSGVVLQSLKDMGFVAIDLGGADLASLTPTVAGDIANAGITDDQLMITWADESTDPSTYAITLFDNSYLHGVTAYDFRDGSIIAAGQSTDGNLTLSGNYNHHSTDYGLNMKVDGNINISVSGSSTVSFLGSQYSSLHMVGTAVEEGDLGDQNTMVENDRSDQFHFVYSGEAESLNFKTTPGSGNDLYLPQIDVTLAQLGAAYMTPVDNIIYYFDFRDGSIIPTVTDGKSGINKGLVEVVVGNSNAYGYNGTQHGSVLKGGNQINLMVAGNAKIRIGGSIYSNGTISVSSETGTFDIPSQSSTTSGNFGNDGSTVDFIYVGDPGMVTLDFTGTNYVPYIEVAPIPYEVNLTPYVQKAGTITINDIEINVTSGEDASASAAVTVSEGTVVSATSDVASLIIDLAGKDLSEYAPSWTGDIDSVEVSGDSLIITYADPMSDPTSYIITIKDSSEEVEAEPGKTYTYNFFDGSELPKVSYQELRYTTYVSKDGLLTINSNTDEEARQFGYHDSTHGGVFFPGNSFEVKVAGDAIITFIVDTYGVAEDAILEFSDEDGNVLGSIAAQNLGLSDGYPSSFAYSGPKGKLTANLLSTDFPTAEIYIHGLTVENAVEINPSNGKIDVWDFGAEQLDEELYNNHLNEDIINAWYDPSIAVGSAGNVLPSSWSAGVLSWLGGGNDRLRTTNTNLTRYDENLSSDGSVYTGRVYVNSGANVGRYLTLNLSEDDEVTLICLTQSGGTINFSYVSDPDAQTDQVVVTPDITELKFVANAAGAYRIFDTQGKPSYFRIYRQDATYASITGSVDVSGAPDLPGGYSVVFTNEAGKSWSSIPSEGSYSVDLPQGYTYQLSLVGANGYIISAGDVLEVNESTTMHDITIIKVDLYTVSGNVTGLGDELANLDLTFTPDPDSNKIFVPEPVIDYENGTYSVELEPNVQYTISDEGVNDYYIPANTITISNEDTVTDIAFELKPTYGVTIDAQGLSEEQLALLSLTFSNLYEEGYVYDFATVMDIALRDGTYTVAQSGLDAYPVELGLTSNLTVSGAPTTKTLVFYPVTNWTFDDRDINSGDPTYKGLLFSGLVSNEVAKGHLATKADATIKVPVNPGDKITVSYYFTADFSIEGDDPVTTNSQSTSTLENTSYSYTGDTSGYVTITIGSGTSTTYITNIAIGESRDYTPQLFVGVDKDFQTINGALTAVRNMSRGEDQRVTIMIDPGNYEEMLVIDEPLVTLKNAAASPGIGILNQGVDIEDNAVRITSYYGHGYHYYSMGNDQKWDSEILRVNKENGYYSYENKGAGTTNGSYWNATVTVFADGFEAEDIIFENSFNQYVSQKETEDILVMWESGSPGLRPTDYGNTDVQSRVLKERAAAIAIGNNVDKVVLNKCRVIGRQDSFYGGVGSRVVVYKGIMMGSVDYIYGGMTAVFYKSELSMNTDDASNDIAYLTAAQQSGERGYLMYECTVTSAIPGTETASEYRAKPGYYGRPWQATTSEVVFYNTTVETTDFPGNEGQSLIIPLGWNNTLGGESEMMYEYGTIEESGEDNLASRAGWATLLSEAVLNDGTEITTFNFTKGDDGWDPLPDLIANETTGINENYPESSVNIHSYGDNIYVTNVKDQTRVQVYSINGNLMQSMEIYNDTVFRQIPGIWILTIQAKDGIKTAKVVTF